MEPGDYEHILVEREGDILRLVLNRPDRLNAVNPVMHAELVRLFRDLKSDPARVAVLTGAGKGFCAGADLKEPAPDRETLDRIFAEARELLVNILEVEKPMICGLNGAATGLGATLALFCDVVIASDRARIGDTHVKVGLAAGDGGAVIWPLLVGVNRAKELLMTGEVLDARKAREIGLVNRVVPHDTLMDEAMTAARNLAAGHMPAVVATKKAVNLYVKWMLNQVFDLSCALEYQCATDLLFGAKG